MSLLEKFFYISVELTSDLNDKFADMLNNLVKESKITGIEAKKLKQDFKKTTERYSNDIKDKLNNLIKNTLQNIELVRVKDLEEIRHRIEELEKKLDK